MIEPEGRPDPDVLLRRMRQEEARSKRGKLKIFFGFAPGVGKTYRMLQVARDLVSDQKLDVVVGIVEDHRRAETAALVLGLELLPRRKVEYRGRLLDELDLDTALARRPKLLLVDELAHTNAPGSRHAKRWQDVEELLAAGIDVFSTMNVQHVDSLNDVVAQITRVQVRETVPDSVLDGADSIELVDIAPEELIERLKEGKVYLPDQAKRAADHFFQRGNLLALRELALRRTAQHVDEDVREYREEHGVTSTWPAGERILVCVGPAPSSGRLIRAAARMAAGLRCSWIASYVEPTALEGMTDADRERLESHLRVAESLGATVTRLSGQRVAEALLAYARKHNVTRIVIGKPTHSRLRDRIRGSLLDEVVRGSGDIDVHVISGGAPEPSTRQNHEPDQRRASWNRYVWAMGIVAVSLAAAALLRAALGLPDLEMLFLLAVMITAVRFGRGPSLVAAALGVACYDFFFVTPLHTFSVSDRKYFLTFAMMFAVSLAMSELAARLRRQEQDARVREERTGVLYALTKELASTDSPREISEIAARHAADIFAAAAVVLLPSADGELRMGGAAPKDAELHANELGVAKWAHEHDDLAGFGTDTLPGSHALCAPLHAGPSRLGVLALVLAQESGLRAEQRAFLDVFCGQVAVALERARLSDEAKKAALRARTEEMRSSLLSAVSHDLRTPLASITGAATTIRDGANLSDGTKQELVESIVDEAERLERLVANLLDMTRLESGGLALKKDWVPLDEIIGSALTRLEAKLQDRAVTVDIAPAVPLVLVDPVLFEQLFVNLLENADKYTPPAAPIDVVATTEGDSVFIGVSDRGPGIPIGTEVKVFDKFHRGPHRGVSGAGLGLAICKGIVEAHGGKITVENRARGGATFHVTIPSGGRPPSLLVAGDSA
ncbi:MAG TPA: sensor histidine kinase KdpD [Polyangiaceae bacterium]